MIGIINEAQFENHIRKIIDDKIILHNSHLTLLKNKKAVDMIICKDDTEPTLFFLEIKYHKNNHGRLGIGQGKGKGFQPEILLKRPKFFENNLRWIIGSENNEHFYFLDNKELMLYIKDGIIEEKYNNIQKKIFKTALIHNEVELIEKLKKWMKV